jgi:Flp pilus assembly protein TadG
MFMRWRRLRRRGPGQEGIAAAEFALCLIPVLLLLVGTIDFGSYYFYEHMATNASRAGARWATRYLVDANMQRLPPPDAAAIQTWLRDPANYGLDAAYTVTRPGPSPVNSGDPLTVTVTRNITWFLSGFEILDLPTQVSASTTMTLE